MYIKEVCTETSISPVFKLTDIAQLYASRMQQLGVTTDTRMHATRLKQKLLARFPDMQAQNKGRDVMLVFEKDMGAALDKPVSKTVTMKLFFLHVPHRLYADTCLTPHHLLYHLIKIFRKNQFHSH